MAKKQVVEVDVEEVLEELEFETEEEHTEVVEGPEIGSAEWSDWLMDQLKDDEKINDAPRTDGLFRLARLIFGHFDIGTKVHAATPDYAAVTCHAVTGDGTQYVGSAEVINTDEEHRNTDAPYNRYPLATAETRAMGRAIKRMLCLTNVITAEETSKAADLTIPVIDEDRVHGPINETQLKFFDRFCKKLDIDVNKTVGKVIGDFEAIEDISHEEARMVIEKLNEWSRGITDEVKVELGSYDSNWK